MKEKILALRAQGKSYNQIAKELHCSKSVINYHCAPDGKQKSHARNQATRKRNVLLNRVSLFKNRKLKSGSRDFQRRSGGKNASRPTKVSFNHKDVVGKFGIETHCYLSGEKINLLTGKDYHFDHIVSIAKGGDCSLKNMGITHKVPNRMKGSLSVEELLFWCQKILEHNGYVVVGKM